MQQVDEPGEQHLDASLDTQIGYVDSELSQARHRSRSNDCIFKNDSVVNVPNVFGRVKSLGTLNAQ